MMTIEYQVQLIIETHAIGGCWAKCCTYHYNTASNGSF